MEWYWWVLIAAALAGIAAIKIKVGGKILADMKSKREAKQRQMEEED